MDIAVLIAAHNEADSIAETVRSAISIPGVTRVVVVDDGSDDETDQLAEAAGAKVVRIYGNVGKGSALEAGAMRIENADIVLVLDGDLGATACQGELLLEPLLAGEADMAVAVLSRVEGQTGGRLVDGFARQGIRLLGGHGFIAGAPLSGQRAFTNRCLKEVRPFSAGYGVEVGASVRALRAGLRIEEVPTTMTRTTTGRNLQGLVIRVRRFVHVALALIALALEPRRPQRRRRSRA